MTFYVYAGGVEPRVTCTLDKSSTTELYPQSEYKVLKNLVGKWKVGSQKMRFFLKELALFHLYLIKLGPFNNLKVRQKEGRSLSTTYLRQERT